MAPPKILVTSALPYANGPIHLGHMVEAVQTDIWVRFLRSCGEDAIHLCADDTHGTPIELSAAKAGITPEEQIAAVHEGHIRDFKDFDIQHDFYGSTHSPENRHYAELIYSRLKEKGNIERRQIEQAFCEKDQRFLPDRFIRGTCPNCKAGEQYGDACEKCGKVYDTTELIDPRCALCGTPPVLKKSDHLFFKLSNHVEGLQSLLKDPSFVHPGPASQLQQFFDKGLSDWDISRDGPYFGFPIPGETNKFFYVWLDAPIGYISTTERYVKATGKGKSALDYWAKDADARIFHFIGKDIVYFHTLFWPAMLADSGLKRPERVNIHGFLTVNGEKMSKSRGTFLNARQYLDLIDDPSYLRFFIAGNLGPGLDDIDLSLNEFRLRVNAELVNNIGNLANRTLSLLRGGSGGKLAPASTGDGRKLVENAIARVAEVRAALHGLDYRAAVKGITEIAQSANQFITVQEPWKKAKTDPAAAQAALSDAAEVAYLVGALLQPIVPRVAAKLFAQLNAPPLTFKALEGAKYPLLDRSREIGDPAPLIARLEEERVNQLVPPTAEAAGAKPAATAKPAAAAAPKKEAAPAGEPGEIEYDDFAKISLKVGKVLAAERVPKADKLLKLTVDVGEAAPRTIAAGIAEAYAPEAVTGRNVVVVTNLKPRQLRGIESRGMLLAAGPGGKELSLVDPGPLPPGTAVK
jgi:methionyl-tRNA synthetase